MPIKIGKSKSSSGSEINSENTAHTDEESPRHKKSKGLRGFLDRRLSKIPTNIKNNKNKTDNRNDFKENENSRDSPMRLATQSVSPKLYVNSCASSSEELANVTSNSASNNPASQINKTCSPIQDVIIEEDYEEALIVKNRSQVVGNFTDNIGIDPKPIIGFNKSQYHINQNSDGTIISGAIDIDLDSILTQSEHIKNEKNPPITTVYNKLQTNNQSIYNEPNDSVQNNSKEIIETCRISQITPTNQFKEIRSRSGSGTEALIVHPDIGVGGCNCSANSSSVGSAQTLSESPAVTTAPICSSSCSASSQHIVNSCTVNNNLTVDVTQHSLSSTDCTGSPQTQHPSYSPKGNTSICHHPASPFSPLPPQLSSSPLHSGASQSTSPDSATTPVGPLPKDAANFLVSRRPCGRIHKSQNTRHATGISGINDYCEAPAFSDTVQTVPTISSSSNNARNNPDCVKASERRSEYYSKHPLYEEAWDVKMQKMCEQMCNNAASVASSASPKEIPSSVGPASHLQTSLSTSGIVPPPRHHAIHPISHINRPQSAAGVQSDGPGAINRSMSCASPPAVPPHRRCSGHFRLTGETKEPSQDLPIKQKPSTKYSINPTFIDPADTNKITTSSKSTNAPGVTGGLSTSLVTADYDYAYNETWSLGVKLNMNLNLSNDAITGGINEHNNVDTSGATVLSDSQTCVMNNVKTSSSASSSGAVGVVVTSSSNIDAQLPAQTSSGLSTIDNDSSLSNDSYEEPWDVRHGRVISELTSTRLIDPVSIRTATSQQQQSVSMTTAAAATSAASSSLTASSSSVSPALISSYNQRQTRSNSSSIAAALINTTIHLDDQPWYHNDCSRSRAEKLLEGSKEGSFLVRNSETCRDNYSLSIKHHAEILHMKISRNSRGYILGQYSQPYVSVPHMLHHYSMTMVPVRGAESVQLKYPVVCSSVPMMSPQFYHDPTPPATTFAGPLHVATSSAAVVAGIATPSSSSNNSSHHTPAVTQHYPPPLSPR